MKEKKIFAIRSHNFNLTVYRLTVQEVNDFLKEEKKKGYSGFDWRVEIEYYL